MAPGKLFGPDGCSHEARGASRTLARIHDKPRTQGANWPEWDYGQLGIAAEKLRRHAP